tara:strand:- start:941 stop:1474 length:534 start_codon:yes stop_codon:yes gene_type:complete
MSTTIDGSASVTINSGAILGITSGTAVASTSGTSITFSSIPTWVKRITVMFNGVSTSGTLTPLVQIGSGSVTSSGYLGVGMTSSTVSTAGTNFTTGFGIQSAAAANVIHGIMFINLVDSTTYKYTASFSGGLSNSVNNLISGGSVTLGGLLDRVVITTVSPSTDTFDLGSINILYEG